MLTFFSPLRHTDEIGQFRYATAVHNIVLTGTCFTFSPSLLDRADK